MQTYLTEHNYKVCIMTPQFLYENYFPFIKIKKSLKILPSGMTYWM